MTCFALDTNVWVALLNGRPARVRAEFERAVAGGAVCAMSSVALFELAYGVAKSARRQANERRLEALLAGPVTLWPLDDQDALVAGEVRAALERDGVPIGAYDVMLAGQALRRRATMVTANTREFARVAGLHLVNWTSAAAG